MTCTQKSCLCAPGSVSRTSPALHKSRSRSRSIGCLQASSTFVAGATGGVGREVVSLLIQKGMHIKALVRDRSAGADLFSSGSSLLEMVQGDVFRPEGLSAAIKGSNAMVIATGFDPVKDPWGPYTVDFQGVRNLIRCGREAGVQKVVLLSRQGVDCFPFNLTVGALFFKKRGEEAVQQSGMDYTIVRPGRLLDRLPPGQTQPGHILVTGSSPFTLPPFLSSAAILRSQVAEVCVGALEQAAASNRIVEIATDWTQSPAPSSNLFQQHLSRQ